MRDITLGETIYFNFTTFKVSDGVPTVLAGSPVLKVLEENNATPITAGVSVAVDRASVVGLNQATVVATGANGYEAGKGYAVYISTGTVDSVSVVGTAVAQFTIEASAAFKALVSETYTEIGQEAPAATNNLAYMIRFLYKALRNKFTATATLITLLNDDGSTAGQKWVTSDDATTFTRGEVITGA